ncbi:MAG: phosphatidylinositol kinase [Gammaproteobacteria bacterium]|jgi:serine/threonine-protein kinase HipA|nr:phosphatidylinositol kinase [Gammaproteobacteria bacterium]
MTRIAKIFVNDLLAGTLTESTEGEYLFKYDATYLTNEKNNSVSLTLPKRKEIYTSDILFPFFDGLIPEGWLMDMGIKNWKLNKKDRMGLLLHLCADCIGNVSVIHET